MKAANASVAGIDPLKDLLSDVLSRLEALEHATGVASGGSGRTTGTATSSSSRALNGSSTTTSGTANTAASTSVTGKSSSGGEVPAIKGYDTYYKECVIPFSEICDDLGGLGGTNNTVGTLISNAWEGIRFLIVLASRAKAPAENDYTTIINEQIKRTQEAVQNIRAIKFDRDYDRHYKAICEMLACLSWVFYTAPKQLPATFVHETLLSAEFWLNRIRKDFKGKDEKHIMFCDRMKMVISGLEKYINEYHKTGLTFNPRGVSIAEAVIVLCDEPVNGSTGDDSAVMKSPKTQRRHPTIGTTATAGVNIAGIMGELNKRKNSDGSSAATGLKHVTKDQQTWRKEFKKEDGDEAGEGTATAIAKKALTIPILDKKDDKKMKLKGLPIFEYQDRGFKWVVENHTKDSVIREVASDTGVITIDINDPKQQVYVYNCDGITVKINGKFKSLVLDKCEKCSVVYDTLISSTEVVNCKKIQLQVNGTCPVFTIDKTINLLIWLSEESKIVSAFTTSLSSELNVCFPNGDDMKELPIPEQFVHKLESNGTLKSDVSDLYH